MRIGYNLVRLSAQTLFQIGYGVRITGLSNVPRSGKLIVASNHRSNYDPPILGGFLPRETFFFAKEELFGHGLFSALISYLNAFPIKRGEFDRAALNKCLLILKNDQSLIFFPEGTRAPADGFLHAKLGLGWVVCLSMAPILPVYIHGSYHRKLRGLNRPGIDIVFGKPISAERFVRPDLKGRPLYQAVSDAILEEIRSLSLLTPNGRVKDKGILYDRDIIEDERLR